MTGTQGNDRLLHHLIQRLEGALQSEQRPWAARDLRQVVALLYAASDTLDALAQGGATQPEEIAATD